MPFDIDTIADIVRPHHDKLIAEGKVEALKRENKRLHAVIRECRSENARLRAALEQCEEYFDDRADADCDCGGFTSNNEMRLLSQVRAALGKGWGQ